MEAAALFDQSERGKVELTGPDAPNFVHNLCTNDVLNLPLGGGCEAFFTTAKAKVVAHALIYHVRIAGGREGYEERVSFGVEHARHGPEKLVA